jgi:hypothetical protein
MPEVTRLSELEALAIVELFKPHGLSVQWIDSEAAIPGSHWGDEEAGLIKDTLYVRTDTPVHSALHEGGHWLVMPPARRWALHTNAGGTLAEENAVCYLQVLMSSHLKQYHRQQLFKDMDAWGYSFRFGSSERWFYEDAEDAREWLEQNQPELMCLYGDP